MPDTIAAHLPRLLAPYVPHPNRQAVIDSARLVARTALENAEILLPHRKKMLSDAIWYLTEADGKYRTRFKSVAVMNLAWNDPTSEVRINHEHVIQRIELIGSMLAGREAFLADLVQALACSG